MPGIAVSRLLECHTDYMMHYQYCLWQTISREDNRDWTVAWFTGSTF